MTNDVLMAYAETKILWAKMVGAMGLPADAAFVAGIPETAPYYREYQAAMNRLQAAIRQSQPAFHTHDGAGRKLSEPMTTAEASKAGIALFE